MVLEILSSSFAVPPIRGKRIATFDLSNSKASCTVSFVPLSINGIHCGTETFSSMFLAFPRLMSLCSMGLYSSWESVEWEWHMNGKENIVH